MIGPRSGPLATWEVVPHIATSSSGSRTESKECRSHLTRIQDHRADYLDFEGPLSGNRGVVRNLASGTVKIEWLERDTKHSDSNEEVSEAYRLRFTSGSLQLTGELFEQLRHPDDLASLTQFSLPDVQTFWSDEPAKARNQIWPPPIRKTHAASWYFVLEEFSFFQGQLSQLPRNLAELLIQIRDSG